jgi:hypothetical protein
MTEHPLVGGNVAAGIVRVGDTVRKPTGYWTPAVEALLSHLWRGGFTGAPRPLGRNVEGRQVLEYVPGAPPVLPPSWRSLSVGDWTLICIIKSTKSLTSAMILTIPWWIRA